MSKQIVLLALASMMLLALAVEAAELMPSSDYAEVQKRHKSKYGAPKDKNSDKYEGHRKHRREHKDKPEPKDKPEYEDKEEPEYKDKPEYKGKDKYKADEPKAPKYEKKDEPRYKTHEDDKHDEYYAPRRDYGDDYLRNYGQDPRTPEKQRYGEYNIEVPNYNERRRGEYYGGDDGYGEDGYYSDAYDRGDYDGKWCKGQTLQDALVNALWKFEDLHLFKHAVMLADLDSLKIAKNASLTIFAPDNHAMKELPELLGKEDLQELFDDETLLLEFVASTITNQGKFMTWDFTAMNTPKNLTTLDPAPPATTLTVRVQPTQLGMSHEITVESDGRLGEEAAICRPSNIKVCKAVIHTVDAPLVPRRA